MMHGQKTIKIHNKLLENMENFKRLGMNSLRKAVLSGFVYLFSKLFILY
jgi:hypothetical protein